jgi:hypothetical protein
MAELACIKTIVTDTSKTASAKQENMYLLLHATLYNIVAYEQ